jgi:hypothetical protein
MSTGSVPRTLSTRGLGRGSRQVSFRGSLHSQNPKTEANKREPSKESGHANSLTSCELWCKRSSLLGFLKTTVKTPCLPAIYVCLRPSSLLFHAFHPLAFVARRVGWERRRLWLRRWATHDHSTLGDFPGRIQRAPLRLTIKGSRCRIR